MAYPGLDRPRPRSYYLFYKGVFFVALMGAAAFLMLAMNSVEHNWNWSRIPKYFWATGESDVRSDYDGTVAALEPRGDRLRIVVNGAERNDPQQEFMISAASTVLVQQGTSVYQGDVLARTPYSKPGILLQALWVTLEVSVAAIAIGIVIGLGTGLCRLSDNPALRWGAITYIEIIRGSPLLVQIYIWYFVIGMLVDNTLKKFSFEAIPPMGYGILALAIFTGAYVAEIVRAGIQSVSRGQMEAARSLGLTHAQAMRKVILPQAFRRIMPPLAGQFISLIKDSSLLGVMAVRELTKATREAVTSSMQSLEMWFVCALLYLLLTFTLSLFVQYLERRAVRR